MDNRSSKARETKDTVFPNDTIVTIKNGNKQIIQLTKYKKKPSHIHQHLLSNMYWFIVNQHVTLLNAFTIFARNSIALWLSVLN